MAAVRQADFAQYGASAASSASDSLGAAAKFGAAAAQNMGFQVPEQGTRLPASRLSRPLRPARPGGQNQPATAGQVGEQQMPTVDEHTSTQASSSEAPFNNQDGTNN